MGQQVRAFIEIDLVQAEWVVTAYCAQDAQMLHVVQNRLDPHTRTGMLISNAPESFVLYDSKKVGHNTDPSVITDIRRDYPPTWKEDDKVYIVSNFFLPRSVSIRQGGKKSNHGFNYDMKHRRFALENEMEEAEAKIIEDMYKKKAYPGLLHYFKRIQRELVDNGRWLVNCFGQTRQFMDQMGPELLNAAYAFKPQSTVGNVTGFGLRRIYNDKYLYKVQPAAQVHDSILNDHLFHNFDELAEQVLRVDTHMTTPCTYNHETFTLRRELTIGRTWGESSMKEVKWEADINPPEMLPDALATAWEEGREQEAA